MSRQEQLRASLKARYGHRVAPASRGMGGGPGRSARDRAAGKPGHAKDTIKRLFTYVFREKARLVTALLMVLFATLSSLLSSYMLRPIINTYIVPLDGSRGDPAGLFRALCLMLLVYLAGVACTYVQSRVLMQLAQNCLRQIRTDLFARLQKLPVKYYDTHPRGDIMSRFTNDIDNIGNMLASTLISLFSAALTLAGTFAFMLYTNAVLTLITVLMVPVTLYAVSKIAQQSAKYYKLQQAALGALNGYIEEGITGQKVVKVFNHEAVAREEFDILNEDLKSNQLRAQFFGGVMGPVMGNIGQVSYGVTGIAGGLLCVLRGFDIGGLTVFLNYSRMFQRPVNELAQTMNSVFSALAGAERVFAVMDEEPEPADAEDAYVPAPMHGDVVLTHVSFGYTPDRLVLKDLSLYAHPGQKIAFVGSTGAGKTTVMNLINRFYDVGEGSVTIDGRDIREYSLPELRHSIAVVLQETHLFTGTIMENIRYGRLDATDEEVVEAAVTASADSFIRRLPKGYQTRIEGDGTNLSQGQRQLLNIARAAVSKAPVLVLDEATSSVDTRTEKFIEQGMDRLMKDRTTFVIAHRLSTVRNADAIMVLENGVIIERGTHAELLAWKGRYYELYTGAAELD